MYVTPSANRQQPHGGAQIRFLGNQHERDGGAQPHYDQVDAFDRPTAVLGEVGRQ